MTTLNDYLYVSNTIPETPDVNRLELTEPSTVKTTASEIKFFKDGADTEDGESLGKITCNNLSNTSPLLLNPHSLRSRSTPATRSIGKSIDILLTSLASPCATRS